MPANDRFSSGEFTFLTATPATRGPLSVVGTSILECRVPRRDAEPSLDVEPDVEHVAVLHLVGLALEPLQAATRRLRVRAGLDEVVPADHLTADEAASDVGVD